MAIYLLFIQSLRSIHAIPHRTRPSRKHTGFSFSRSNQLVHCTASLRYSSHNKRCVHTHAPYISESHPRPKWDKRFFLQDLARLTAKHSSQWAFMTGILTSSVADLLGSRHVNCRLPRVYQSGKQNIGNRHWQCTGLQMRLPGDMCPDW